MTKTAARDYTINTGGADNRCPPPKLPRDGTTDLIDGFVRDGWISPEHRDAEVALIYRGLMRVSDRRLAEKQDDDARRAYATGWVDRWLADMIEGME